LIKTTTQSHHTMKRQLIPHDKLQSMTKTKTKTNMDSMGKMDKLGNMDNMDNMANMSKWANWASWATRRLNMTKIETK